MRWFWIDRFLEFESGRRAKAIKNVSLVEEQVDQYFPGFPIMTPTLVLEGFAQMGGLLIGQQSDFQANIVLAKVSRSKVFKYPRPGDQLVYQVTIQALQSDGGLIHATSHLDGELQLEADLTFVQVGRDVFPMDFFEPVEFLEMLRIFQLFRVGVDVEGKALPIPPHLLAAERAQIGDVS